MKAALPLLWLATALAAGAAPRDQSLIITSGRDGRLVYGQDQQGNRVPDFSHCGFGGGGVEIPDVPVRVVVRPQTGDETRNIQQAIDYVGSLPPDNQGFRGAVLLRKGLHRVLGGLQITNSGVILRGQGAGEDGTTLMAAGLDRRTFVRIAGLNDRKTGQARAVTDDYVPVGALSFHVEPVEGLKPGGAIRIIRPSTQGWIERLGATGFGGGVGGGWRPGSRNVVWESVVKSVQGGLVTVDAPMTTALEKEFGGGRVETFEWPSRIRNAGVENLRLVSEFDAGNARDEAHAWCAITLENAQDAWVRQVVFEHFAGSAVAIYETCRRATVQDCLSLAPVSEIGGYRRHTFFTMGQQTLFLRCYAEHGRHDFSVGDCAPGPNAFVQCEAREARADSGPIESWASGVLYDNVNIDGNALSLGYRPGNNAGVGWAAANCVLWNCSASVIRCWNPPGARNWSFGSWASFEGDGSWRSSNDFMKPDSLFAAQLRDRLGAAAAGRLNLMPRPREESSNPPLDKAQELAAASHQPASQLKDYILKAGERDAIPSDPGGAKSSDDLGSRDGERAPATRGGGLRITNGWLTCDGKLLIGGTVTVAWWRGSLRPEEAAAVGPALTRFVPGRTGPGLTDDLGQVAEALVAEGKAALDHNYGLWYDRRRDDHERVRRMDGDALPPFFELPFARSGQGRAWDGMSQYDLTKYNSWYWSRLREFAGLCDQRGLVLFHQNYFQHNILEAGAHWADFPWRSANNVNQTGFPEPPPYAGDKRIFQAELFYDVTHPVRRKLHEAYIRQCLDNFTNQANVIQFTSAEFTGPLHFMEFWLDTVAAWERGSAARPIVALSATKDVQDAILADARRLPVVDVIDFRYWWRTSKGEFAPPGGKNLAPRQFERQWRGGRPADVDLAGMAAEYRATCADKALICDFDSAGWAWLCAGGSMPRLPRTTDPELLGAIPRMKPWIAFTGEAGLKFRDRLRLRSPAGPLPLWGQGRWALCEPGEQFLLYLPADDARMELDLQDESAPFAMRVIDPLTGTLRQIGTTRGEASNKLPKESGKALILWLTKER